MIFVIASANRKDNIFLKYNIKNIKKYYPNSLIIVVNNTNNNFYIKDKDFLLIENNTEYRYELGA